MPSYKDLLKLMRQGKSPQEILDRLPMRPSHLKRMLWGKRFRDALKMREDLAVRMVAHQMAAGVHDVAERFSELLETGSSETVRKVCLALLHEGLRQKRLQGTSRPARQPDLAAMLRTAEPVAALPSGGAPTDPTQARTAAERAAALPWRIGSK